MAQTVRHLMTEKPVALQDETTLAEAARAMRDHDIGNVVVLRRDQICGIVTDRDIAIRGVAEEADPVRTTVAEVCSQELTTISPDTGIDEAVRLMRARALRRLPVVEDGRPIGIVSIGDLAMDLDSPSTLAVISAARSNR